MGNNFPNHLNLASSDSKIVGYRTGKRKQESDLNGKKRKRKGGGVSFRRRK